MPRFVAATRSVPVAGPLSGGLKLVVDRFDFGEDALCGAKYGVAACRRNNGRFAADEQRFSQFLLQVLDLVAQCRLGEPKLLRREAEAARFHDRPQRLELLDFHRVFSTPCALPSHRINIPAIG